MQQDTQTHFQSQIISQTQCIHNSTKVNEEYPKNIETSKTIQKMIKIFEANKLKIQKNKSTSLYNSRFFENSFKKNIIQKNTDFQNNQNYTEGRQTRKTQSKFKPFYRSNDQFQPVDTFKCNLKPEIPFEFSIIKNKQEIMINQKQIQKNQYKSLRNSFLQERRSIKRDYLFHQEISNVKQRTKRIKTSYQQNCRTPTCQNISITKHKLFKKDQSSKQITRKESISSKYKQLLFCQQSQSNKDQYSSNFLSNTQKDLEMSIFQLTERISIKDNELSNVSIKVQKYEDKIKFLQDNLKFEKNSYRILLEHHNNELLNLNTQVSQLQQKLDNLKNKDQNQNEIIDRLNQRVTLSENQVLIKQNQIKSMNSSLLETITINNERVNELQATILKITNQLNESTKKQCESTMDDTKQFQEDRVYEQKYFQLLKYVQIMSTNNTQYQDSTIHSYIKQLFQKNEQSSNQILGLKIKIIRFQDQLRIRHKIINQMKYQLQKATSQILNIRNQCKQTLLKHDNIHKILDQLNQNLIAKQIQFGNLKYESIERIQQLQEQNSTLKKEIEQIYLQLNQKNQISQYQYINESEEQQIDTVRMIDDIDNLFKKRKQQHIISSLN